MDDLETPVQTSVQSDAAAAERARIADKFERWFEETFHNRALPTDLQNMLSDRREAFRRFLRGEEP